MFQSKHADLVAIAIIINVCCFDASESVEVEHFSRQTSNNHRGARKLFGGYRITPRFCKPTRKLPTPGLGGPNVCMFNHECAQRNGQVVGACMDGFLFGACCQLPEGVVGELMESDLHSGIASGDHNNLQTTFTATTRAPITSIRPTFDQEYLPTAQEDAVVQIGGMHDHFSTPTLIHSTAPDTYLLNHDHFNDIAEFHKPKPAAEERKTTRRFEGTTSGYGSSSTPYLQISISNSHDFYSTPKPIFEQPNFRPKPSRPSEDKFVLIPTIAHPTKPNKTQELDSIINIIQMLNDTTTTTSYSNSGGTIAYSANTTKKPPSTSYVFSLTPSRRPTVERITTTPKRKTPKPQRKTPKPTTTLPTTLYFYPSSTTRPGHSTYANSPSAFLTTSKKPPSTSYVFSTNYPKRPTVTATTSTPAYSVSGYPTYSSYGSQPPTIIILGSSSNRPNAQTTPKPASHLTITHHVTHNLYSTESPHPTVLITPKPSLSTTPQPYTEQYAPVEMQTSVNDLINFPPVRNPNLNISSYDEDFTTPEFLEDDLLNFKMESFVNKIVQGLQEPYQGLQDVVADRNTSVFAEVSSKPTKKPAQGSNKPQTPSRKPTTVRTPTSSTKRPSSPKKPTPARKTTTTTVAATPDTYLETELPSTLHHEYRQACGIRPLLKSGRIVGGKGASFGEFPWQVLVRESTWLGLFTKNKCGGVLISSRYVMTAAHCQPGFLASLVAVFGEHDISGERETKRSLSRNVKRVIVHRQYDAATFENDLALLELEHPIALDEHIVPVCLPREGEDFTGRMATVTGWGRLKYGGGVPSILQEVQVPIMENQVCQEMFRTAGHNKVILESFLCAGYANGQKDSCEGDSGGPLVLQRPDGRYQLAGTVSHGIKCAAPYLPGVYMRTAYYKPWIESVTGVH